MAFLDTNLKIIKWRPIGYWPYIVIRLFDRTSATNVVYLSSIAIDNESAKRATSGNMWSNCFHGLYNRPFPYSWKIRIYLIFNIYLPYTLMKTKHLFGLGTDSVAGCGFGTFSMTFFPEKLYPFHDIIQCLILAIHGPWTNCWLKIFRRHFFYRFFGYFSASISKTSVRSPNTECTTGPLYRMALYKYP